MTVGPVNGGNAPNPDAAAVQRQVQAEKALPAGQRPAAEGQPATELAPQEAPKPGGLGTSVDMYL